ncbi:MAG: glycosyltransferase family 1 protein [Salinivirgaceae bacterium]
MELHLVSLNVPYPANYGGVIDIFFKIKALNASGVGIHLHCYDYGRGSQDILNSFCRSVTYYKREVGLRSAFSSKPYIVKTRNSKELLVNLCKDSHPILFEGLHTTYWLNHPDIKNRIKIVRTHNLEHEYYQYLSLKEKNLLRKIYFKSESGKLERYESILKHANAIAAISPSDAQYFKSHYPNTFLLPAFHPYSQIKSEEGLGTYLFYHGDLSVRENIQAALFLVDAFKDESLSLVFAGNKPSKELVKSIQGKKQFQLIENPSAKTMSNLLSQAHVVLLPTFQPTGIKLKLIASLYEGRHCIVNTNMVKNTGLENLCHLADSREEFVLKAKKLMSQSFDNKDLIIRKEILGKWFDNQRNAGVLIQEIQKIQAINS